MWQIRNTEHVLFAPTTATREDLVEIRAENSELKGGLIQDVLQLAPESICFYTIYRNGSRKPEQDSVVRRLDCSELRVGDTVQVQVSPCLAYRKIGKVTETFTDQQPTTYLVALPDFTEWAFERWELEFVGRL